MTIRHCTQRRRGIARASVLAAVVLWQPAAAGVPERRDDLVPAQIVQVLADADGGALVLGRSATRLVRVGVDDAVALVEHPAAGTLLQVAARPPEVWALGTDAVLHRDAGGSWRAMPRSARPIDHSRPGYVVGTGEGQAVVVHAVYDEAGYVRGEVVWLDASAMTSRAELFEGTTLRGAVADGRGGFWTVLEGPSARQDDMIGYARWSSGRWTVWRTHGYERSRPTVPYETRPNMAGGRFELLAPDGDGGAYGLWGLGVSHVDRNGALGTVLPPSGPRYLSLAHETGGLVVLWSGFGEDEGARLGRVTPRGEIQAVEPVPFPRWFTAGPGPPPIGAPTVSASAGSVWISTRAAVLSRRKGEWTVYASRTTPEQMVGASRRYAWQRRRLELDVGVVAALSVAAVLAAGTLVASRLRGAPYRVTAGAGLMGATSSVLPAWYLHAMSPARAWSPGLEAVSAVLGFLGAVGAAPVLGALGAWGAAELLGRSVSRPRALAGALLGAAAGTAAGVGLTYLLPDVSPDARPALVGVIAAVVAVAAATGHQALGGGPKRRPGGPPPASAV